MSDIEPERDEPAAGPAPLTLRGCMVEGLVMIAVLLLLLGYVIVMAHLLSMR